jgi:hypothetical protein
MSAREGPTDAARAAAQGVRRAAERERPADVGPGGAVHARLLVNVWAMNDKISLAAKLALLEKPYEPGIVGFLNDYKLQVVKVKGRFVWHKHDETDDFFLVLSGRPTIHLRDRDIELEPGDDLAYAVINVGELPLVLGAAYELERIIGDGWERVAGTGAFRAWGRRLDPGGRYELTARVPERAQSGRYRLRKRVDVDRDPHPGYEWVAGREIEPVDLTAEFYVVSGRDRALSGART